MPKPPPKSLMPILNLAATPNVDVDEFLAAMAIVDPDQLRRNAFHVLQAIPNSNSSNGTILFAAVHHAIQSDRSIFAMLADTCVRGPMPDKDAAITLRFLFDRGWAPLVIGLLVNSCAENKVICANLCRERGLYRSPMNWPYVVDMVPDAKLIRMARNLISIVSPSRDDLLALRLAAKSGSELASFLDEHLNLDIYVDSSGKKH